MSTQPTDDLNSALRQLANRWVLKARDFAREAKNSADPTTAAAQRASAEAYNRAAMELAELLQKGLPTEATGEAPASAPPAEPEVIYAPVPLGEALRMLDYCGASARDCMVSKANVFTAIFSRWQPLSVDERLALVQTADPRIIILATGKTKDTGDPTIDFAFKP